MYCKFCGNRIDSNTTKCASCGAIIDLRDGGQSFFDDNELDAWRADDVSSINIPRTEMREALPEQIDKTRSVPEVQQSPRASTRSYRSRRKKKKTLLDRLNLSSANRLIIFCIASALAIVLLVAAIISVFNSGKESTDDTLQAPRSTENIENIDNTANPDSPENSAVSATTMDPVLQTEAAIPGTENNSISTEKEEIKGIRIIINDREINYPVSAYRWEKEIYVSMDSVLKAEGYNDGIRNRNFDSFVTYENTQSGRKIMIKGKKDIRIKEENEKPEDVKWHQLDGDSFNEGSHTYVHAQSFFRVIGYNNVVYDEANKILKVSK